MRPAARRAGFVTFLAAAGFAVAFFAAAGFLAAVAFAAALFVGVFGAGDEARAG